MGKAATSIDIEALARDAGASLELGPGDEPTTSGWMFWRTEARGFSGGGDSCPSLVAYTNAVLEAAARECESEAPYRVEFYDGELRPNAQEGRLRAERIRALKVAP